MSNYCQDKTYQTFAQKELPVVFLNKPAVFYGMTAVKDAETCSIAAPNGNLFKCVNFAAIVFGGDLSCRQ
jgi:hypothetical protein